MVATHTDYVWILFTWHINLICDNLHVQFHYCINCVDFKHEFQWFILLYFYRDLTLDNLGHIMVLQKNNVHTSYMNVEIEITVARLW